MTLLWSGAFVLVFSLWLFHGHSFNTFPPAKAELATYGGAARPYSARVLVPWTVRLLLAPIPRSTRHDLVERWADAHPSIDGALGFFDSHRDFALELALTILLDAAALAGFLLVLRKLLRSLYASSAWVERSAPVVAVLLLPLFFARSSHFLYDFPALFLFTAALLLVHQRRTGWLALVLFFGTLNKESMALALVVCALDEFGGTPRPRRAIRLGGLTLVVVAARLLAMTFSHPAATAAGQNNWMRNYFTTNLAAFLRDPFLFDPVRLAALLLFVLLILAGYQRKPPFLCRILPVTVPFLALYVWGSLWGEIRALYELVPILFLMGYQTVCEAIGLELAPRAEGAPAAPPAPSGIALWPMVSATALGLFLLAAGVTLAVLALP
ncbi:MAG: hypothetical protein R2862_09760 [Thermoanaerobaculia bacterium]